MTATAKLAVAKRTRVLLIGRGWCQGSYRGSKRLCLVAAIEQAAGECGAPDWHLAAAVEDDFLSLVQTRPETPKSDRADAYSLERWNDLRSTTFPRVMDALDYLIESYGV